MCLSRDRVPPSPLRVRLGAFPPRSSTRGHTTHLRRLWPSGLYLSGQGRLGGLGGINPRGETRVVSLRRVQGQRGERVRRVRGVSRGTTASGWSSKVVLFRKPVLHLRHPRFLQQW